MKDAERYWGQQILCRENAAARKADLSKENNNLRESFKNARFLNRKKWESFVARSGKVLLRLLVDALIFAGKICLGLDEMIERRIESSASKLPMFIEIKQRFFAFTSCQMFEFAMAVGGAADKNASVALPEFANHLGSLEKLIARVNKAIYDIR